MSTLMLKDILKAACKDAMTSIQSVDKKLIKQFMESAKNVAEATEDGELKQIYQLYIR